MKLVSLSLLALCIACGQDDSKDPVAAPQQGNSVSPPVSDTVPEIESSSHLVQTAANLLPCSENSQGHMAYVFDEKAIYACDGQRWSVVDLRGEKGTDGAKGDKGDPGEVLAAEDEIPEGAWVDPIDGSVWIFLASTSHVDALASCVGDYRLPTSKELRSAAMHGLANNEEFAMMAWSNDPLGPQGVAYEVYMRGAKIGVVEPRSPESVRGVFCLYSEKQGQDNT